jgi:APA family basic amino acid/polyamine antiporter
MESTSESPSRLARRLGTFDAVVMGLGSMIGAGVFVAFAPAARAAGNALLVSLVIAAFVAYCNATSSAALAAIYPASGGTYIYGRERLGPRWGYIAGWGFVVGKLASCAAMAMTFGSYVAPTHARPFAIGAVIALTGVNYLGVAKTALVTRGIVVVVLATLAVVVGALWAGGAPQGANLWPLEGASAYGILQAAGFLFFAFAGYARIATLGEEVRDPKHTIPRAIPLALAIALVVYAAVAVSLVASVGAGPIAASTAPLAVAIEGTSFASWTPIVRVGAAVASLGVLLSLIAGISRTMFAMAANRDLPSALAAVHPRHHVPHRAVLLAGAIATAIVVVADVRGAIGFSSFAVLVYYAIANASAWTLPMSERRWLRPLAGLGLAGCVAVAVALPWTSVVPGLGVLAVGLVVHAVRTRSERDR